MGKRKYDDSLIAEIKNLSKPHCKLCRKNILTYDEISKTIKEKYGVELTIRQVGYYAHHEKSLKNRKAEYKRHREEEKKRSINYYHTHKNLKGTGRGRKRTSSTNITINPTPPTGITITPPPQPQIIIQEVKAPDVVFNEVKVEPSKPAVELAKELEDKTNQTTATPQAST